MYNAQLRPMRATLAFLLLTGCWWKPCPTEGEIDILVVDGDENEVCPDEVVVIDPDGTEIEATCDCGTCTAGTFVEGEHTVIATLGEAEATATATLSVFERCVFPRDDVVLTFP